MVESDIIERCKRGDSEAFRVVVQGCQQMVYSLSLKMLCNEDDAMDLLQDTFLKVWLNIASYDGRSSFSTWIYSIASHLCIDRLRKQKPILPLPGDETALRDCFNDNNPQRMLENKEWEQIVRLLAGRLSVKQRLVFTLCQLEGLETAEVERITGMSADKIKNNLYVARQTIREQLKKMGYE